MKYISNQPETTATEKTRLDRDERLVVESFRSLTPENQRKAIAILRRLKKSQD